MSPFARNVRYHLTSVRTRDSVQATWGFSTTTNQPVTGLAALKLGGNPNTQIPVCFDAAGNLFVETPVGSGHLAQITSTQLTLPANASMQAAAAFKKGFFAFTDLQNSAGAPAVLNLATMALDPLSMKLQGQTWTPNTVFQVGEVVTPTTIGGNGHTYRCTIAGTSGAASPVFPTTEGGTVTEGGSTLQWTETTPLMAQVLPEPPIPAVARSAGAGTFAAARDVYIIVTLVNGVGETDAQVALAFKFTNTTLNDRFVVTSPTLATWIQGLQGAFAVTGYNVYEADVATGGAAPAIASYHKVNVGAVAIGVATNVNTTGGGAVAPTSNGALVVPAGNICSGLRYGVVLFVNRNGYISGMTQAAVFSYTSPTNGFQLYIPHIPTGPANTQGRIVALTPAGQLSQTAGYGVSSAGPYFWIPPAGFTSGTFSYSSVAGGVTVADVVNGIQMTSTYINDNVSTTATFNFTDDYLKSTLLDVSAYFRKIQVPNCSDIYYAPSLRRMFYAVDALPSGWYVSLAGDPESVYGDKGLVQASENNGELRTAVREYGGTVYLMKERSGYVLSPDATDPSTWRVTQQWTGAGPCGFRAVDVCTNFMCFVHRSGVYIFSGSKPERISTEIPLTWASINWSAAQTIWVLIDEETREIRIGVPTGQSTVPNVQLKCNYEESPSFSKPIHFSPYVGKEIASGECYKWSVDDIPANLAIRAERVLVNPPASMDYATTQSQILHASSNPDGAVSAVIPWQFSDVGADGTKVGIDSIYETACHQDLLRPNLLGGVQANIDGYGNIALEVLALRAKDPKQGGIATKGTVIPMKRMCSAGVPYSCGARAQNERFRLRVSNNKQLDTWFDMKWAAIMAHPISVARPG